jgi:sec-independent protein translocase protein TatB
MFEVGFLELALCALVALLVFGPERLPRVAREAALWLRKVRLTVNSVKQEIQHELEVQDLKQSLAEQKKMLESTLSDTIEIDEPTVSETKSQPQDKVDAAS